ncbi:MAG: alpha-D-ribose 1-methylphosphonate 5-triphosphate diphosphatase [Pseudomonadota bacterium]
MSGLALNLQGGSILRDGRIERGELSMSDGLFCAGCIGRAVDLTGYLVLPGIVDVHGDGFERHVAPRRGAMKQVDEGLRSAETELAANGVTTGVLAQFYSWEGGLRGPDFADRVFKSIARVRRTSVTDLRAQLRFELNLVDDYLALPQKIADWGIDYVVFNDHLPHDRLSQNRKPARLTGQALKAGRSPEAHLALMQDLHARRVETGPLIEALCQTLSERSVRMGSHDEQTAEERALWRARGARICEFPVNRDVAEAAKVAGDAVIMGAPNIVRGGSHNGNVSALDLVTMGLCDALASDYHYPSLRRAVLFLVDAGVLDLAGAWALISSGPAAVLGLSDRGEIAEGRRADFVVLDAETRRIAATFAHGRVNFMTGDVASRFLN